MATEYWIVPHTHWDREWYLSFQDFRWRLVATIDGIIDTLESDPRFSHFMLDGQAVALEDYLEFRGERRGELETLVAAGRLAVGPWYVQPDDILPTGEALVRNLERGIALAGSFGATMMVGYLPDSFGHGGSLPSVLRGFGIESACLMRGPGPSLSRCLFEWKARDGSSVLVAYLIDGYGNGADLVMEGAEPVGGLVELRARQEAQGALFEGLPLLVMNGYDHRPIESRLPDELEKAGLSSGGPESSARIGSLETYIAAAREAARSAAMPEWRGELRSTYRCPITAGCVSTRQWIKKEDQEVSALLEGRAEPLAALAAWAGAARWPAGAIEAAWKLLLLNQAHDSICGCSIDRVHRDMEYRYAQARDIAANVEASASAAIAGIVDTSAASGDTAIVVLNPGPRRGLRLVSIEVPASLPDPVVVGPEGRAYRAQSIAGGSGGRDSDPGHEGGGESSLFFDERFKPAQVKLALGLVRGGELMNYRIAGASTSWESPGVLRVDLELSDAALGSTFDWPSWLKQARAELESPELKSVHAVGRRAGPATLLFPADAPEFGASCHVLRSARPGEAVEAASALASGPRYLENEFYRVDIRADGSLDILDKAGGFRYRGQNALVDGGDRGDEYDYDRPPRDRLVERPRRGLLGRGVGVRLAESGPLRASAVIEATYLVPAAIDPGRDRRSRRRLAIATRRRVSLAAGSRRIEFRTEIENAAKDHRLRASFPLPGRCEATEVGGNFEIFLRPAAPEPPEAGEGIFGPSSDTSREFPPTTHPFTGFVGAPWSLARDGRPGSASGGGLALLARGLREYEILEREKGGEAASELCLTLFRSVGRLSRGDLSSRSDHAGPDIPTPDAQMVGSWAFEYAIMAYDGELASSEVPDEWADYRHPQRALVQTAHPGRLGPRTSLLSLEGGGLAFSSLRSTKGGALSLRFFDVIGVARRVKIRSSLALPSAMKTRLDGEPIAGLAVDADGGSFIVEVAPYEIVTVELRGR